MRCDTGSTVNFGPEAQPERVSTRRAVRATRLLGCATEMRVIVCSPVVVWAFGSGALGMCDMDGLFLIGGCFFAQDLDPGFFAKLLQVFAGGLLTQIRFQSRM